MVWWNLPWVTVYSCDNQARSFQQSFDHILDLVRNFSGWYQDQSLRFSSFRIRNCVFQYSSKLFSLNRWSEWNFRYRILNWRCGIKIDSYSNLNLPETPELRSLLTNGIANTRVLPDPVNETTFASHSPTTSGLSAYRCTGSGLAYPKRSKFLNKILNSYFYFMIYTVRCVFSMVIWSEIGMGKYRDDDHRET